MIRLEDIDLGQFNDIETLILMSTFNNVPLSATLTTLNVSQQQFQEMLLSAPFNEAYRTFLLYNLNQHHSTLKTSANLGDVKSILALLDREKPKSEQSNRDFLSQALAEARQYE